MASGADGERFAVGSVQTLVETQRLVCGFLLLFGSLAGPHAHAVGLLRGLVVALRVELVNALKHQVERTCHISARFGRYFKVVHAILTRKLCCLVVGYSSLCCKV